MPRRSVKHIIVANKDDIIQRYVDGETQKQIAERYDLNPGSVSLLLSENGVTTRNHPIGVHYKSDILTLNTEGLSAYAIAKKLGLKRGVIERMLHKEGIDISWRNCQRADRLVDHADEIIARYLAGEGGEAIGKDYNTSGVSILDLLRRKGIAIRALRDYSYEVNESYFNNIDTANKAYVLGFMMADGCNMEDKGVIEVGITDLDILRDMANDMKWQGPISESNKNPPPAKTIFRLRIGCRKLSDALAKVGCVANKTYLAQFPTDEQVPPEFHNALVLGWHDGDGTLTSQVNKYGRRIWNMRIVGTKAACEGISACVNRHLGFSGCVCPVHVGPKHTTYGFSVQSQPELAVLLEWLYKDKGLYLKRKFDKYQDFLKDYAVYTERQEEKLLKRQAKAGQ